MASEGPGTREQPTPVQNDREQRPAVWDMVLADMKARDEVGRARYGVRLRVYDGRDTLVDAYQEALDLTVYLRKAIAERDGEGLVELGGAPMPVDEQARQLRGWLGMLVMQAVLLAATVLVMLALTGCGPQPDAGLTVLQGAYPVQPAHGASLRSAPPCPQATGLAALAAGGGAWWGELQLEETGDVLPAMWLWQPDDASGTTGRVSYWSGSEGQLAGSEGEGWTPADAWWGRYEVECGQLVLYCTEGECDDRVVAPMQGRLAPVVYGGAAPQQVVLLPWATAGGWAGWLALYPQWTPDYSGGA